MGIMLFCTCNHLTPPVPEMFICSTIMNITMLLLLKTVHFKKAKNPKYTKWRISEKKTIKSQRKMI